jgi:protein-S-isoprenylcysteine O-methyltransferase Ste14
MWVVRFILLGLLMAVVAGGGILMKRRKQYEGLLENRMVNLALVVVYLLLCLLMSGLPSDPAVFSPPAFWARPDARAAFSVFGFLLIGLAVVFWIVAVRQRKALGAQDVKEGLLTSGLYRYFRHPIYTSIIWISLGLALLLGTWDGWLMIPAIFLVNALQAFLEKRCDVGVRFSAQYAEYRKQTRMFGPFWVWMPLAAVLIAVPLAL